MDNIIVYYINLDKKTERNTNVLQKLNFLGFKNENIKRFSAINGINLKTDLINKNYINNEIINLLQNKNINIRLGELSCSLSHYFIYEEIINDERITDDTIIFIFEDDFFINEKYLNENSFISIINDLHDFNKNEWDLIYMGGRFEIGFTINNINESNLYEKLYKNFYKKNNNLNNKQFNYHTDRTTHNYIIQKKTAIKLKNICKNSYTINNFFVIDNILNYLKKEDNLKIIDYFPHIFYSPINYITDIQNDFSIINTSELTTNII